LGSGSIEPLQKRTSFDREQRDYAELSPPWGLSPVGSGDNKRRATLPWERENRGFAREFKGLAGV
jgi:hypothetical protein